MTAKEFRRIALGMAGAVEGEHMAHPDFRANGRIFATIHPDGKQGMVKLAPEQQREFMAANPAMFVPAAGAWGRSGCTMVQFSSADHDVVGEAMTLAWQSTLKAAKKSSKNTSSALRLRRR
jgi:YjbR